MDVWILDERVCKPVHDTFALILTSFLCAGIVISYLPQHYRILSTRTSEGISPWFLLLGSTSSAAGMLNVVTLQWGVVRCCASWTVGQCLENTIGILQVSLQWAMFTLIVILFLLYYPPSRRQHHIRSPRARPSYSDTTPAPTDERGEEFEELLVATAEWNEAKALCALVFVHLVISVFVTFWIVLSSPPPSPSQPTRQAELWAGFQGITASLLACFQYAPQLYKTYRDRLVGALSIPMMCIQCPGAVLFVISLAIREGTNWTSWLPYAAAGVMQGMLLTMCLVWKARQARLGIDDFGNPILSKSGADADASPFVVGDAAENGDLSPAAAEEASPQLEQAGPAPLGLPAPAEEGQEAPGAGESGDGNAPVDETTPLMVRTSRETGKLVLPWFSWGRSDSK